MGGDRLGDGSWQLVGSRSITGEPRHCKLITLANQINFSVKNIVDSGSPTIRPRELMWGKGGCVASMLTDIYIKRGMGTATAGPKLADTLGQVYWQTLARSRSYSAQRFLCGRKNYGSLCHHYWQGLQLHCSVRRKFNAGSSTRVCHRPT